MCEEGGGVGVCRSDVCVCMLRFYIPVHNFSLMSGHPVQMRMGCLAQGHNTVPLVRLEPTTPQSQV